MECSWFFSPRTFARIHPRSFPWILLRFTPGLTLRDFSGGYFIYWSRLSSEVSSLDFSSNFYITFPEILPKIPPAIITLIPPVKGIRVFFSVPRKIPGFRIQNSSWNLAANYLRFLPGIFREILSKITAGILSKIFQDYMMDYSSHYLKHSFGDNCNSSFKIFFQKFFQEYFQEFLSLH